MECKGYRHENSNIYIDIAIGLNFNEELIFKPKVTYMTIRKGEEIPVELHGFQKGNVNSNFPIVKRILEIEIMIIEALKALIIFSP